MHLELVTDLTTATFLNCLKRFVSRRGFPQQFYSDNAKTFVSADKELQLAYRLLLKSINDTLIHSYLLKHKIMWKFMPPRGPHHGGLHEAAVKRMKFHLKRVVNNTKLHYEDFYTVLCQIEAILNSRPLYPLSNSPEDLTALTPGHFLVHGPLTALPQQDVLAFPTNRLKHYEMLQAIVQTFWQRWKKEYLSNLQQRSKWRKSGDGQIEVGDMVILKEEGVPPQDWPLGRIVEIHPAADGSVRVVSMKTSSGTFKRDVRYICVLPVELY